MTKQNRVTPWGTIEALSGRGDLTGNRGGRLHDDDGNLVRAHTDRRWISCQLEFKDRRKPVMGEGTYSSLFFLDEAAALAAGHRPCFECRRPDAERFLVAWRVSQPKDALADVDRTLHAERLSGRWPNQRKVTYRAPCSTLPTGAYVEWSDEAWVVSNDHLLSWTPDAYIRRRRRPQEEVTVLTPPSLVQAIRDGFEPAIHHTAV
jgi:hypothetical protein